MKTFLKVLGVVLTVLAIVFVVSGFSVGWRYMTAEIRGIVGAEEQIQSSRNRLDKRKQYYDLCRNVRSYEVKIQNAIARLENTKGEEAQRIRQNLNGLRNMRSEDIAKYNSFANQEGMAAQFRASDLPAELEQGRFENGDELTECSQ